MDNTHTSSMSNAHMTPTLRNSRGGATCGDAGAPAPAKELRLSLIVLANLDTAVNKPDMSRWSPAG